MKPVSYTIEEAETILTGLLNRWNKEGFKAVIAIPQLEALARENADLLDRIARLEGRLSG